jgi:hypothetical protein
MARGSKTHRRAARPGGCHGVGAVVVLLLLMAPSIAAAQVAGDDSFRYTTPQQPFQLRAGGLIGGYLGLQLISYSLSTRPPDPMYDAVYTPWDKTVHGAISYDSNTFRTNFIGHPTMGTVMYLMARGSRLPAWQSSLWTVAGSTTWEWVEYNERASINDLIVTPLVGISIGEPLFQVGAHLDRTPRTTGRNVLSWIVSPFKKLNDLYDHAEPARGDPDDSLVVWAGGGGTTTSGGGATLGDARLEGGWRLIRSAEYGAPGHAVRGWVDGQVTAAALSTSFRVGQISDGRVESSVLLASLYARDLDEGRRGSDLVAGVGVAFELRGHRWTEGGLPDFAGLVSIPRGMAEARWLAGDLTLTARLEASILFGGSRSYALDGDPAAVPWEALPTGQQQFGYHFGFGAGLHPALLVKLGQASLLAEWRGDSLWRTAQQPDPRPGHYPTARLEERWGDTRVRVAWRFGCGLELAADAEWRQRWSLAGDTTRTASDRSLGLSVGWMSDP